MATPTYIQQLAFCLDLKQVHRNISRHRTLYKYETKQSDTLIALATEQGISGEKKDDHVFLTVPTQFIERPAKAPCKYEQTLMDFYFGTDDFMGISEFINTYHDANRHLNTGGRNRWEWIDRGISTVDSLLLAKKGWNVFPGRTPKLAKKDEQYSSLFQEVCDLFFNAPLYTTSDPRYYDENCFYSPLYIGSSYQNHPNLEPVGNDFYHLLRTSFIGDGTFNDEQADLRKMLQSLGSARLHFESGASIITEYNDKEGLGGEKKFVRKEGSHFNLYYQLMCRIYSSEDLYQMHENGRLSEFFQMGAGSVKLDASVEAVVRSAVGSAVYDGSYGKIHHWVEDFTVKARLEQGPFQWDLPGRITKSAVKKLVDQIKESIKQHYVQGA